MKPLIIYYTFSLQGYALTRITYVGTDDVYLNIIFQSVGD